MAGAEQKLTGLILMAAPCREYDRRLVILTRERGKITAFARGARKQGSPLLGTTYPFSYGVFTAYEGRDAFSLVSADIQNSFSLLKSDLDRTFYASYFAEMTSWFTREGPDEGAMMKLLYVAFRALETDRFDQRLIRFIFETKTLLINGMYPMYMLERRDVPDVVSYTVSFLMNCPPEKVYTFELKEESLKECVDFQKKVFAQFPQMKFKSLDLLELSIL